MDNILNSFSLIMPLITNDIIDLCFLQRPLKFFKLFKLNQNYLNFDIISFLTIFMSYVSLQIIYN